MKKLQSVCYLICLFALFSCESEPKSDVSKPVKAEKPISEDIINFDYDSLIGIYSYEYDHSVVRIEINYCSESKILGRNIFRGKIRNLSGKVKQEENSILIELEAMGDMDDDPSYSFKVDPIDYSIKGQRMSLSKTVDKKNITLKRLNFQERNEGDRLTIENAFYWEGQFQDSIGGLWFSRNGKVEYEEVYSSNEGGVEKITKIKGSWFIKNGRVFAEFEENDLLETNPLELTVIGSDYGMAELVSNDRRFYFYEGI